MKIVVSLPEEFKREDLSIFLEGVSYLKKLGHNVFETLKNVKEKNEFPKIDRSIKDSDILIAEISSADLKVGFEIARALDEKKVVILFSSENTSHKSSYIFKGGDKNLLRATYNSKNIISVTDSKFKEAAGKLDSKFILIISPEIDRYLDWAGQTKRLHKAQIVRTAIEQMIKKDKDYKTYLQN